MQQIPGGESQISDTLRVGGTIDHEFEYDNQIFTYMGECDEGVYWVSEDENIHMIVSETSDGSCVREHNFEKASKKWHQLEENKNKLCLFWNSENDVPLALPFGRKESYGNFYPALKGKKILGLDTEAINKEGYEFARILNTSDVV